MVKLKDTPNLSVISEAGKFHIVDENGYVYGIRDTKKAAEETKNLWIEYYQSELI